MEKRKAITNLLRAVADAIDCLSDEELEAVLSTGSLRITTNGSDARGRISRPRKNRTENQSDVEALMADLARAESREEARNYLNSRQPSRTLLLAAAKSRSVHISREDKIPMIIEKLIANTVGSRLDAAAIRNS